MIMHELQKKYESQIKKMVSVCHSLADDKYVTSHGGNLSWAVDRPLTIESNILITPTKKFKGHIEFDDICIVDYEGNILYAPEMSKPTGELPFHILLFHERHDIVSIVHAHPPYTTALAICDAGKYLSWPLLPEPTTEIGPVCIVPFAEPLTQKLANNFRRYLDKYNAFLMGKHGITMVYPEDLERTRQLIDLIECTSKSIIMALAAGKLKSFSKDEVAELENTRRTRNMPLPGRPGMWKSLVDCYNFEEICR